MLGAGAVAAAAISAFVPLTPPAVGYTLDTTQQSVSIVAVVAACLLKAIRATDPRMRHIAQQVSIGLFMVGLGFPIWLALDGTPGVLLAVPLLLLGALTVIEPIARETFFRVERSEGILVVFDCAIVFFALEALAGGFWQHIAPDAPVGMTLAVVGALGVSGGAAAVVFSLVARDVPVSGRGLWPALGGIFIMGLSWLGWLMTPSSSAFTITPFDFTFTASMLLLGFGIATIGHAEEEHARRQLPPKLRDGLPVAALVCCVVYQLVTPVAFAEYGTAAVVLCAVVRQLYLGRLQRASREAERRALLELRNEAAERAATNLAVSRIGRASTLVATAQRVCDAALGLPNVDVVRINRLTSAGEVIPIAAAGLGPGFQSYIGQPIAPHQAEPQRLRAAQGPWVDTDASTAPEWKSVLPAFGVRGMTNVPLAWNGRLMAVIGLGTRTPTPESELRRRIVMTQEFASVAAAILGPMLEAQDAADRSRQAIDSVIERTAFHPVFQPVVDLVSGLTIGFEALTRFDDGQRPDRVFEEAARVGRGLALEVATLRLAVDEAASLPETAWLSLNVSPELAVALVPLIGILENARRRVVVEITEHPLIEDYERLAIALAPLRSRVGISVDDAGAGYAGLRHILELQPEFVKLDIGLIRSVDTDPARRALIGAMAAFARETGCAIIAEGIEREPERETLQALGVAYGQGYLLGRPEPIDTYGVVRGGAEDAA